MRMRQIKKTQTTMVSKCSVLGRVNRRAGVPHRVRRSGSSVGPRVTQQADEERRGEDALAEANRVARAIEDDLKLLAAADLKPLRRLSRGAMRKGRRPVPYATSVPVQPCPSSEFFWDKERLKLRESLARLVCDVMQLADGDAIGDS
jgi:hypothetical protein